jgi:excisionase family DNA binding protein
MNASPNIADGFATVADTAVKFQVSRATVQRWIRDGALPSVRLGRLVLIPKDALRLLLERQEKSNVS